MGVIGHHCNPGPILPNFMQDHCSRSKTDEVTTHPMICLMFLAALISIILMPGLSYLTLFLCMENL